MMILDDRSDHLHLPPLRLSAVDHHDLQIQVVDGEQAEADACTEAAEDEQHYGDQQVGVERGSLLRVRRVGVAVEVDCVLGDVVDGGKRLVC